MQINCLLSCRLDVQYNRNMNCIRRLQYELQCYQVHISKGIIKGNRINCSNRKFRYPIIASTSVTARIIASTAVTASSGYPIIAVTEKYTQGVSRKRARHIDLLFLEFDIDTSIRRPGRASKQTHQVCFGNLNAWMYGRPYIEGFF